MRSSLSLGRILGFPVDVHFTLLILLGFIGLMGGGWAGVLLTSLVFASVLAHELGHAVVARRLGVRMVGITLYPFGGMAKMAEMPESSRDEMLIAGAGPLVSLLLGAGFAGAWFLTGSPLLAQLAGINVVLGVFNLIPALPMDGGRIFRAALSMKLGFLPATRIATTVARVVAVGLGIAGLFTNGMLVIIAAMVWWMAGSELRVAEARAHQRSRDEVQWIVRQMQEGRPFGPRGGRASQMVVEVDPA